MKLLERAGCSKHAFLASLLLGVALVAGASLAAPPDLQTDPPTVYVEIPIKRLALNAAVAAGDVSMSLVGDSHTVTHVQLYLANETDKLLDVSVPAGQVFVPEDPSFQYMMVTQPARDVLAPDSNSEFKLSTVCISPKSVKPPAQTSTYMVGQHPDERHEAECMRVIEISQQFDKSKKYDDVPIAPERRAHTIAQLAIWMNQGERSRNPKDKVTRKTIADDVLRCAGKSLALLNPAERQTFDDFVDRVFEAIDRTRKEAIRTAISTN
jgi:hypothetical protein